MGRYIKFEENDDGTCTAVLNLCDEEITMLFPMSFDDFINSIASSPGAQEFGDSMSTKVILIPNTPED